MRPEETVPVAAEEEAEQEEEAAVAAVATVLEAAIPFRPAIRTVGPSARPAAVSAAVPVRLRWPRSQTWGTL